MAPRERGARGLGNQKLTPQSACGIEERERTIFEPGNDSIPTSAEPAPAVGPVHVEHALMVAGMIDGHVRSDNVLEPHLHHLLVGDHLADTRSDTSKWLFVAVFFEAKLAHSVGCTVGVVINLSSGYERDLVLVADGETVI